MCCAYMYSISYMCISVYSNSSFPRNNALIKLYVHLYMYISHVLV